MHNPAARTKREKRYNGWFLWGVLTLFILLFLFVEAPGASATETAPVNLVNHVLKECVEDMTLGDECFYCTANDGWEISAETCPTGYMTANYDSALTCITHPQSVYESTCGNYDPNAVATLVASYASSTPLSFPDGFFLAVSLIGFAVFVMLGVAVLRRKS